MKMSETIAKLVYQYANLIDNKDIDQKWYELPGRERWFDASETIMKVADIDDSDYM